MAGHVQAMFTAVTQDEGALGLPVCAATLHWIHATLRAALNGAVRAGLISVNPGRHPELPRAARPRPQVWTPALTGRWQLEGWRPAVGVWTAAQTAQFLRYPARQPSSRRPAPRRAHRRLPAWAREDHRKRRHAA